MQSLLKVLLPLAFIAFVFVVFGRRRQFKEDIGWKIPRAPLLLIWVLAAIAYTLATDAVLHWRGTWDWEPWRRAPVVASVLRVLGLVFLGPISEELLIRGLLQSRLARRLTNTWAILLQAGLWSFLHVDYSIPVRAILLGFGLILGLARFKTDSICTPIVMHWAWNFYAVW